MKINVKIENYSVYHIFWSPNLICCHLLLSYKGENDLKKTHNLYDFESIVCLLVIRKCCLQIGNIVLGNVCRNKNHFRKAQKLSSFSQRQVAKLFPCCTPQEAFRKTMFLTATVFLHSLKQLDNELFISYFETCRMTVYTYIGF